MAVEISLQDFPRFEAAVNGRVIEHPRLQEPDRRRWGMSRAREEGVLGLLQCGDGLLSSDRGKIAEELSQRLSRFKVLDQRLDRHSRAGKDRRSAHDLRIDLDD